MTRILTPKLGVLQANRDIDSDNPINSGIILIRQLIATVHFLIAMENRFG